MKNLVLPEYNQIEEMDDGEIIRSLTGHAIAEYVYSFKQGGRTVEGLTIAGINEAANRKGGVEVSEIQTMEGADSWKAIVKATDRRNETSRYGAFEQPKVAGGRPDPFAFTKAVHKAQRNAIKQLLPMPVIKEILTYYLRQSAREIVLRYVEQLSPRWESEGLKSIDFWNYVKQKFGVSAASEVSKDNWEILRRELLTEIDRVVERMRAVKDNWKAITSRVTGSPNRARDVCVKDGLNYEDTDA
jgi:hypothetical protein